MNNKFLDKFKGRKRNNNSFAILMTFIKISNSMTVVVNDTRISHNWSACIANHVFYNIFRAGNIRFSINIKTIWKFFV